MSKNMFLSRKTTFITVSKVYLFFFFNTKFLYFHLFYIESLIFQTLLFLINYLFIY